MANGWGGYREPTNAAPVSGPGALSQRTDGPLRGPAAGGAPGGAEAQVAPGPDLSQIVPFGAPSQRPDEPITAGMPYGPGAGSTRVPGQKPMSPETAKRLRSYLPVFILLASSPDADPETKQYVRQLRGELG